MLDNILENFIKQNNTLIKNSSLLDNELEKCDFNLIIHSIHNNLKNMNKSEIINFLMDSVTDSYIDTVKIYLKMNQNQIEEHIKLQRNTLLEIMSNEQIDNDIKFPYIIEYLNILYRSIDIYSSSKIINNVSTIITSMDLINYILSDTLAIDDDYISILLNLKQLFFATLSALVMENLNLKDNMKKNTCILIVLNYIVKYTHFDDTYTIFYLLFCTTLLSNKKNQEYIKNIVIELGYTDNLNTINAAILFINQQIDELYKFIEENNFGEDIILLNDILFYLENYSLSEKKLNEVLDLKEIHDNLNNTYMLLKKLYTELIPSSIKLYAVIKKIINSYTIDDEEFMELLVSDAVIYAKKTNVFEKDKAEIYKTAKEKTNIVTFSHILLDNKEYDLLLKVAAEIDDQNDITIFLFFMKHNKQAILNYDALLKTIKKNKNIMEGYVEKILNEPL